MYRLMFCPFENFLIYVIEETLISHYIKSMKRQIKTTMKTFSSALNCSIFKQFAILTFLTICGIFYAIPAIAAENSGVAGQPKTLLRIMGLPNPKSSGVEAEASRAIVHDFLKKYPYYKVIPFHMPSIKGGMDEGPLMAIATGLPPHGIYVNFRQSSTYIDNGFLAPMEEILARLLSKNPKTRQADANGKWLADPTEAEIKDALKKLMARVIKPVQPVVYRASNIKRPGIPAGNHFWSMPTGTISSAIIYRKDVFKEANLDPNNPPKNWNQFLEYCRKIKTLPGKYGFYYCRGPNVSWSIYNFMVSNGVRYLKHGKDGKWRAAFNTMNAAESIYYVLVMTKGQFTLDGKTYNGSVYAPMNSSERALKWDRGEIGMQFTSLSYDRISELNPALVGVAPTPLSPTGHRGNELNCRMMGIFSGATPEQKLGIMRYIWYITGDQANRIKYRIYVDYGYGKFLNPILLKKFGYNNILKKIPEGWKKSVMTAMKHGVPEPYGQNTQLIYLKVSVPINWALNRPELLDLPKEEALKRIKEQLDIAAARVDKFMLGELSESEWRKRRVVGGLVLVLIMSVFALSLGYAWRCFTKESRSLYSHGPLKKYMYAYFMILPGFAMVLFVKYLPLVLGAPLALFDYQLVVPSEFVGIDNFATVLYDKQFWFSMLRTFYYVALVVGLGFWPPILVAILLDEVPTTALKYIFRTIFYLPTIVSGVIMVFLWRQLYESSESGFLNQILMYLNYLGPVTATIVKLLVLFFWLTMVGFIFACAIKLKELSWPVRSAVIAFSLVLLGGTIYPLVNAYIGPSALVIEAKKLDPAQVSGFAGLIAYLKTLVGQFHIAPLRWIEDPKLAMICCVIPMIWATAGPGCILYLAALKTVPEDLVEAATIDGAGLIQKISYITLPRIKFLILIQLLGAIVGAFRGGTNFILAMTAGGPNGATRTIGMDIFERSFMQLKFGIGTAMGWILGAMVIVLTTYQIRRMSRAQFTSAATSAAKPK